MTYKQIRVKMRGGGSRLQRVKVLASGKYRFVKNVGARLRRKTRRPNPKRGKSMARRWRRKRRGRGGMTIPIAPVVGLAAGTVPPIMQALQTGDYETALSQIMANYTGYNYKSGQFNVGDMAHGLLPLVLGGLVHKFVGGPPLNINRVLGRARVPLIRI